MSTEKSSIEDIKNEIKATWFWYKVCEGCDTVTLYEMTFCPKCRGYRFDENRKRVIDEIVKRYEEKFKRNKDLEQSEYSD
jgi:rRNA maturation endonuclease Nob1